MMQQFSPDASFEVLEKVRTGIQALFKLEIVLDNPFLDPRLQTAVVDASNNLQ